MLWEPARHVLHVVCAAMSWYSPFSRAHATQLSLVFSCRVPVPHNVHERSGFQSPNVHVLIPLPV